LIPLADIEVPSAVLTTRSTATGSAHDRMVRLLSGIRDDVSIPAIYVEPAGPGKRPYRVREGVHRYHASRALGFSHMPAEIVERID
jgi:hypothetical protein